MKYLVSATALTLSLVISPMASATPQQEKMKTCNADAKTKDLKGDERKAFMKTCLSNKPEADAKTTQQEKMKSCNADAKVKALTGEERKTFMSTCLKG
jgi:uncharacterized membrane protein